MFSDSRRWWRFHGRTSSSLSERTTRKTAHESGAERGPEIPPVVKGAFRHRSSTFFTTCFTRSESLITFYFNFLCSERSGNRRIYCIHPRERIHQAFYRRVRPRKSRIPFVTMFRRCVFSLLLVTAVQFLRTSQVVALDDELPVGHLLFGGSSETGQLSTSAEHHAPATPPHLRSLQAEPADSASRQYGSSGVPFTTSQVTSFAPDGTSCRLGGHPWPTS